MRCCTVERPPIPNAGETGTQGPADTGPLLLCPESRTAIWREKPLQLTPKEFDLLALLAAHPGEALSRHRLMDEVWGADFMGDFRTVDCHIKNLREKLGDGAAIISTVWGVGYRFVEPNLE